jgi:hypothetical protein
MQVYMVEMFPTKKTPYNFNYVLGVYSDIEIAEYSAECERTYKHLEFDFKITKFEMDKMPSTSKILNFISHF